MNDKHKHKIVPYKVFGLILAILLAFTFLSILLVKIELGDLAVAGALLFATAKTLLVFGYFMHLRFDKKIFTRMVIFVIAVLAILIFITFLDYIYR